MSVPKTEGHTIKWYTAAGDDGYTGVRRAERLVARLAHNHELRDDTPLKYLNRLSSLIFVMARLEDRAEGVERFTLAAET